MRSMYSDELLNRASQIRLLALDVDGVLTTGDIIYTSSGEEIKAFDVKDGHGLFTFNRSGFQSALITARESPILARRAADLAVPFVFQGIKNKWPVLERLAADLSLTPQQIAYMGDDEPDLAILRRVGLACCPADAIDAVRACCHFISRKDGGRGAVRELTDLLLWARPRSDQELSAQD